jgi:hypothetical protein
MKHTFIKSVTLTILIFGLLLGIPSFADEPPPPDQHGANGNQPPGGGAPIGEGLVFLTMLGAAYGAKKWQKSKQTN